MSSRGGCCEGVSCVLDQGHGDGTRGYVPFEVAQAARTDDQHDGLVVIHDICVTRSSLSRSLGDDRLDL